LALSSGGGCGDVQPARAERVIADHRRGTHTGCSRRSWAAASACPGEVHFDACTASTEDQYGYFLCDGQIVTLVDDFPLASAAVITNETFLVVRGFDILPQT